MSERKDNNLPVQLDYSSRAPVRSRFYAAWQLLGWLFLLAFLGFGLILLDGLQIPTLPPFSVSQITGAILVEAVLLVCSLVFFRQR